MGKAGKEMDKELKRRLERTLTQLESICIQLEEVLKGEDRKEKIAVDFVDELFKRFRKYLKNASRTIYKSIGDPAITEDDVLQDIIEYMLRWNLDEVVFRSSPQMIWLPNLKRSVSNCYVNMKAHSMRKMRVGIREDLGDVHDELIQYEDTESVVQILSDITKHLDPVQRTIFANLVRPSDSLCSYAKTTGRLVDKEVMCEFLGISPTIFSTNYTKIRGVAKEICKTC
jgi:hypothetical protein